MPSPQQADNNRPVLTRSRCKKQHWGHAQHGTVKARDT